MAQNANGDSEMPLLERAVAALGLLLVLGATGFLIAGVIQDDHSPPAIQLTVENVTRTGSAFVVNVTAHNNGSETAANARVEGLLADASGRVVERSEVTLDYLPGRSRRRFGLIFSADPRAHHLQLRATGYHVP